MAETYATEAKTEGDVGAPLKNPLRNLALAGLADHVRLAQLGQRFFVGICSDTAPQSMSLTVALLPEAQPPARRASTINKKHVIFMVSLSPLLPLSRSFFLMDESGCQFLKPGLLC